MIDALFIIAASGLFGLCALYIKGCERL